MPYPRKGVRRILEQANLRHRSANIKVKAVDYSNPIYDIDPIGGSYSIQWKGAWNSSTAYITGDVVSYGGSSWVAKVSNTNVTPVEGATWTIVAQKGDPGDDGIDGDDGRGFNPRGAWATATVYAVDDIVTYGGQTYRVKLAGTSASAPSLAGDAVYELWAQKGADGTGATVGDLDDLTDVIITGPVLSGDILKSDGTYFRNVPDTGGDGTSDVEVLDDLNDVEIIDPTPGQTIIYDGDFWRNVDTQEPVQMGAFRAYMNISSPQQNFTTGVTTPLIYPVEDSDDWGWYNPTTGRYTPQEPGWYVLGGSARITPVTTGGFVQLYVLKNGAEHACIDFVHTSRTDFAVVAGASAPIYANGTTDFFQLGLHQNLGISTPDIDLTNTTGSPFSANNFFSGAYIGAASSGSGGGDISIISGYAEPVMTGNPDSEMVLDAVGDCVMTVIS